MSCFRHSCSKVLAAFVCASLLAPQMSVAYDRTSKWWLQGDVGAGYQQIDPKVANELVKSGFLIGGRGLLEYRTDNWGAFGVGAGIQQTWQDGETDTRIQKYTLRSILLDGSYLYPFASKFFWVGWLVRTQVGEGARFDFFGDINSVQALVTTGPQVRLNFATEKWDWVVGASALVAINSSSRTILNVPVYVGISIPISTGESSTSVPVASALNSANMSDISELQIRVIHFDLNQSILSAQDRAFLSKLARVLIEKNEAWKEIAISGHTDVSGGHKNNQMLSEQRAIAIKSWLVREGVPIARLRTSGHGSDQLLPNVDFKSSFHRRAVLSFEGGVKGDAILKSLNALQEQE